MAGKQRGGKEKRGRQRDGERRDGPRGSEGRSAGQREVRRPRDGGRPGPERDHRSRDGGAGEAASRREPPEGGTYWLYGRHAVIAALANPARRLERLLLAESPDPDMTRRIATLRLPLGPEVVGRAAIEALLPPAAVHQGLALKVRPLAQEGLAGLLESLGERAAVVVALDHVTDPQNVGAILRSAAAFGAAAVLTTQDHAPPEGATMAKAASGGLEVCPYLRETNLARALDQLKEAGFWVYGLDEAGEAPLTAGEAAARSVVVLGAEGEGLRRLTRERCDRLFRLPTRPPIAALNVSNAAAVALYELLARR